MTRSACKGGDLDKALEATEKTLLLLAGAKGSDADAVYEEALTLLEPLLHKALLICDPSILSDQECAAWFADKNDGYAVLAGAKREVAAQGPVDDLLKQDGTPSVRKILKALNAVGGGT